MGAALRLTSEPAKPSIALAIGAPRFHRRVNSDSAVLQAFSRSGGNCASSVHSACLMDGPRTWRKDSARIRSSSSGRSSVAPRSSCRALILSPYKTLGEWASFWSVCSSIFRVSGSAQISLSFDALELLASGAVPTK